MLITRRISGRSASVRGESLSGRFLALAAASGGGATAARLLLGSPTIDDPLDAVVFLASIAVIVIGSWWIANVLAWSLALRRGHTLRRFTLPGTKRLAKLLLAVSLSSACVADADQGPAMVLVEVADTEADTEADIEADTEADTEADPQSELEAPAPPSTAPTSTIAPASTTTTTSSTVPSSEVPATEPALTTVDADADRVLIEGLAVAADDADEQGSIPAHQVVVREDDNLWSLAQEALEAHGVTEPTCDVIAKYWRQVVAGNRVGSGNVDLIVPGETIEMPAYDLAA